MRLIMVPDTTKDGDPAGSARLEQAISARPLNVLIAEAARHTFRPADDSESLDMSADFGEPSSTVWVIPQRWNRSSLIDGERAIGADGSIPLGADLTKAASRHPWLVLSNGRFVTQVNKDLLDRVLTSAAADVVAVTVDPQLRAHQERIRLTPEGELVGCRRLYRDVAEPTPAPGDWPHHVFMKSRCAETLFDNKLPRDFDDYLARCRAGGLKIRSFAVAGTTIDLTSPQGLLILSRWMLSTASPSKAVSSLLHGSSSRQTGSRAAVSPQARLVGSVLMGGGVRVEAGAVVVGPVVLCDGCTVGPEAWVDASIVGPGMVMERGGKLIGSCRLTSQESAASESDGTAAVIAAGRCVASMHPHREFRTWSRLSYARCLKRVADILAAALVIVLFAPIIPLIALAIRINSPGPIFYRDWRQGLHGRPFHCIKFRTMRVGAAAIQDKLRFVSEVDGPQFKINDDPRISGVGHFLRETSIDEIPQFFNVLLGQMSVVGPRPSPEAENTQCPSWRDARLSVRPGITGLWQVCRTRQPFKDFQEWIYYDTKYVQELSLGKDLWICVQTFKRLLSTFVEQF
jgi:lipopolysaccharide/colanic/teichoic acid biosynthesis glycosyltransferase